MRIIAGQLGGRVFEAPRGHRTHPMSDKMRGALFNSLGDIEGLDVLDAFAGSGALAFEALSRGATEALLIEQDKPAQVTIRQNIEQLGLQNNARLVRAGIAAWLSTNTDAKFDIILCDPPYNDLRPELLKKLSKCLNPNGTFVLSWPGKLDVPNFKSLKQITQHNYGDGQLVFYRQIT